MDPSPLGKASASFGTIAKMVRGSPPTVTGMVIILVAFLCAPAHPEWVRGVLCIVLCVIVLLVVGRYAFKGPEGEQRQSFFTMKHDRVELKNIDISDLSNTSLFQQLLSTIVANRRLLPPDDGSVTDAPKIASGVALESEQPNILPDSNSLPS